MGRAPEARAGQAGLLRKKHTYYIHSCACWCFFPGDRHGHLGLHAATHHGLWISDTQTLATRCFRRMALLLRP